MMLKTKPKLMVEQDYLVYRTEAYVMYDEMQNEMRKQMQDQMWGTKNNRNRRFVNRGFY